MSSTVSVVCPLESSASLLPSFLGELEKMLSSHYEFYEVILVDDGSCDGTRELVRGLLSEWRRVRYLRLASVSGREMAITVGLESSLGDYVVVMVPGVDPPALVPVFVSACRGGKHLVLGVVNRPNRERGIFYGLGSWFFHAYCGRLGLDLVPGASAFRCLSRQAVDAVTRFGGRTRCLRLFLSKTGFSRELVPYEPLSRDRCSGVLTSFWDAVGIMVGSSTHPLRLVGGLGLCAAGLSFFYAFYVVAIYFFRQEVAEGWTTLSLQMSGMFFLLFLLLTVLCEYVGRVLEEVQHRPLYFLSDQFESPHSLEKSISSNVVDTEREVVLGVGSL